MGGGYGGGRMTIAVAAWVAAVVMLYALWRWLFGETKSPAGWDQPPADWLEEMETKRREFGEGTVARGDD